MYFHLIWIKEENWEKNDLDLVLEWWNEDIVRKFLMKRWVVVVSITEFKGDPKTFGNISILVIFENTEIWIFSSWENLEERASFFINLWITPHFINFIDNPISEEEMQKMINSIISQIKKRKEKIEKEKIDAELKEQKKYSESAIEDTIALINIKIVQIEQILKAWNWLLSWQENKALEDSLNEMKKIRLWTNFNKMATLVMDTNVLLSDAMSRILKEYSSQWFPIDSKSSVTNIDLISNIFDINIIKEKGAFYPETLTALESVYNIFWTGTVFGKLLTKDLSYTIKRFSFSDFFSILMGFLEDICIIFIMVISLTWLISTVFWVGNFSLYLLPALWWLGLLIYLYNNLNLKWIIVKCVWFVILVGVYWTGLVLLLNTFSL